MKVKYNIKPVRGEYEPDKFFTFGNEYKVMADYRNRRSGQKKADNGFVVTDNQGNKNMIFLNEVEIIEDGEKCFTFSYSK